MKQLPKYVAYVLILIAVVISTSLVLYAASGSASFPLNAGIGKTAYSKALVKAQVDTLIYVRKGDENALAFAVELKDSGKITSVTFQRGVNGIYMAQVTADTLSSFYALTSTGTKAATQAVTLAPLADQYRFIVTYDTTTTLFGVTTPTVNYEVLRQFSK